jgi:hypothetical protein
MCFLGVTTILKTMRTQKVKLYSILFEQEEEASDSDEFGKWFAPISRRMRGNPMFEPNTDLEQQIIDDLDTYFSFNNPKPLEADRGHEILLRLKNSGKYKQVLEPGVSHVFRGMKFPDTQQFLEYVKALGVTDVSVQTSPTELEQHPQTKTIDECLQMLGRKEEFFFYGLKEGASTTYKPVRQAGVSSWTSDPAKAFYFTQSATKTSHRNAIVLTATTAGNNFFGKPGEIGKLGTYEDEMEVVGVGEIKLSYVSFRGSSVPDKFAKVTSQFDALYLGGPTAELFSERHVNKRNS